MGAGIGQNFSATCRAECHKEQGRIVSLENPIEPQGLIMTHITGVAAAVRAAVFLGSAADDGGRYNALSRSLISGRINNIQRHGQEKIRNQDRQRRNHHRFRRGPPHPHCPLPGGQSFVTADENDQDAEDEGF